MSATAVATDFAGRVLGGKYLVGAKLGSGGFGTVYAAVQRDLGRPVAIKVLDGPVADQDIVRFEREARAAAALGNPHIVQVTDFSSRPDEPSFLVMEMLEGETLGSLIQRSGPIPAARMAGIAQQVLAALDAAHRAGIVHRDVKPANIFLVANAGIEDFVKLLDFGIAKLGGDATAITQSGAMLGSPAYMAPEQVKASHVDPRTDIYALGATTYHALSGRYPFEAPSVHALLYAIAESHPPALASLDASIDPRMVAVVERAMQKDPSHRFQSAGEMRAALSPGAPSLAPVPMPPMMAPTPRVAMPTAPARSNAGLIVAIASGVVLVFLLVVAAGFLFFFFRENPAAHVAPPATAAPPPITAAPPPASIATVTATATAKKAGPTPTPSVAPAPMTAFAGTNPRYSSGAYRAPIKSASVRPAIDAALPAIKPCFVATEFDAPDHRSTSWLIAVDASGVVTSATRKATRDVHPKLDSCVTTALRAMKLPPIEGSFEISLYAPSKDDL